MLEQLTLLEVFRVLAWAVLFVAPLWSVGNALTEAKDDKGFPSICLAIVLQLTLVLAAYAAGGKG